MTKQDRQLRPFTQLLLRAAVCMPLIVSGLAGVQGWESASEKRAAEFLLEVCTSGGDRGMAGERKPQ